MRCALKSETWVRENKMTNNDKVQELNKAEFDSLINKGKGFVVVDFYAEWCMPCLMMAPVIDELSEKFKGKIRFVKVNVEDNQELSQKYKIRSIPNIILFKEGKIIKQFFGSQSAEDFEEKLKGLIK